MTAIKGTTQIIHSIKLRGHSHITEPSTKTALTSAHALFPHSWEWEKKVGDRKNQERGTARLRISEPQTSHLEI